MKAHHTPISDSILRRSVHLADVDIRGEIVDFRMTPAGVPVLVFSWTPIGVSEIHLPEFSRLDELCAEQSYCLTGKVSRVSDIIVEAGLCAGNSHCVLCGKLMENIEKGIFVAVAKDGMPLDM